VPPWTDPTPTAALVARRQRLHAALGALDVDLVLIVSGRPRSRNYAGNVYPFRAESHFLYLVGRAIQGAALVLDRGKALLFVEPPASDDPLWHGEVPGFDAIRADTGVDEVLSIERLGDVVGARWPEVATLPGIDDTTAAWQSRALGREIRARSGAKLDGPDARLADAMIALRLVHDEAALAQMRRAIEVTTLAHHAGARALRPGVREAEVHAAIDGTFMAHGMSPAYGSIVTVNGEVLHNEAHHNVVRDGDLLLVDAGAETSEGWASDVTRVFPASGRFSATQRAIYDVVLAANRAAIAKVAPGVRYRDVHLEAGRTIVRGLRDLGVLRGEVDGLVERGAYTVFFPHGVGHLLGLDVHDMEDLGDRAGYAPGRTRATRFGDAYLRLDRDLAPGMAVTIEPGFYQVPAILRDPTYTAAIEGDLDRDALARFADVRGIRLEDDVLVTATGAEIMTRAIPIGAAEVEAWMKG
jgi:Xaa-Pro aminopeptidase